MLELAQAQMYPSTVGAVRLFKDQLVYTKLQDVGAKSSDDARWGTVLRTSKINGSAVHVSRRLTTLDRVIECLAAVATGDVDRLVAENPAHQFHSPS